MFLNGVLWDELPLNTRVPQGSVLGPLLFFVYINDIADKLYMCISLYADDTTLSFSSLNLAEREIILNNDLTKLKEWAISWLIRFNPAKMEVVLISNFFHDYDLRLIYNDTALNIVESHKYLGIYLSLINKWTKHIDSIVVSAAKQVSSLRKLNYQLSRSTRYKLYCTYIRPLLEYGCKVWDGCSINGANHLEQIQ